MSGRTRVESLLRGWLPQNPLESETSRTALDVEGELLNGKKRLLRFGGLSGVIWSVLSLLSLAGLAYVVGIGSPLYSLADVSTVLTAVSFFVGMYLVFPRPNRSRARTALSLGIMSGLAKFSMYLSSQVVLALGLGSRVIQELARMGYYASLQQSSVLLAASSIILFGTLASLRSFRLISTALGAMGVVFSLLGLATVFTPRALGPLQLSQEAQTLTGYIPIIWVVLMSVSLLFSSRTIGWRMSMLIIGLLFSMCYLTLTGVFWPRRLS